MREAQRLGQILVEPERARNHAADLRDFEAMGQTGAVMVAVGRDEDLRLRFQPAEAHRMDDPVTVALERAARAALFAHIAARKFAAGVGSRVGSIGGAGHHAVAYGQARARSTGTGREQRENNGNSGYCAQRNRGNLRIIADMGPLSGDWGGGERPHGSAVRPEDPDDANAFPRQNPEVALARVLTSCTPCNQQ